MTVPAPPRVRERRLSEIEGEMSHRAGPYWKDGGRMQDEGQDEKESGHEAWVRRGGVYNECTVDSSARSVDSIQEVSA